MSEKAKASAKGDSASASEAKIPAAEKLEAARQKVVEVASGMREGAGRAGATIREGAGRASEVAKEKYAVAKDNVRQGYDRVTKDLDQLSKDVNEYVRHNPGKSVLIAAAVGFFLGAILRGGRRG
jgi:ElaB/YqjD/DUF883 family membrane-anchored ribosome-binding protein